MHKLFETFNWCNSIQPNDGMKIMESLFTYNCSSLDTIACVVAAAWNRGKLAIGWRNISEFITKVSSFIKSCCSPGSTQCLVVYNIVYFAKEKR